MKNKLNSLSGQSLETYLNDSHLYVYCLNWETKKIIYANPAFCKLLGYLPGEVESLTVYDIINHSKESIYSFINPVIETKQRNSGERQWKTKCGKVIEMLVNASYGVQNGVKIIYVSGQDITDYKKEQQKLLASEKKFRSVLLSAKDSIILANEKGDIIFWNHFAEKTFGYNEDEVLGKPLTFLMPGRYKVSPLQKFREHLLLSQVPLMEKTIELYGLRKNGKEFPLEFSLSHWTNENERYYCGIIRDITERKIAEENQKNNIKRLSEIAFLQSHQVRAPIASILGLISLINFEKPEDPQNIEVFHHLKKTTLFCDQVIKEIVEKTTVIEELAKKI